MLCLNCQGELGKDSPPACASCQHLYDWDLCCLSCMKNPAKGPFCSECLDKREDGDDGRYGPRAARSIWSQILARTPKCLDCENPLGPNLSICGKCWATQTWLESSNWTASNFIFTFSSQLDESQPKDDDFSKTSLSSSSKNAPQQTSANMPKVKEGPSSGQRWLIAYLMLLIVAIWAISSSNNPICNPWEVCL